MTTVTQPRELWNSMPGWGIVANLLPTEVLQARRVRAIRKLVIILISVLLVIAAAGYAYAYLQSRSAAQSLAAEQSRTSQLTAREHQYSDVTQIQGSVAEVQSQLSTLLANDVNTPQLLSQVMTVIPAGGHLSQVTMNLAVPNQSGASTLPLTSLDTSGHTHIGTVTLVGQVVHLTDVATYVDALALIPGVVQPYPTTNTVADKGGATFSIQLTLTDQLFTHSFSPSTTGGK